MDKHEMASHVTWSIGDDGDFAWRHDDASISAEARLDGVDAIRTSLPDQPVEAACRSDCGVSGRRRARTPVASKTAFAIAAPAGPQAASPAPR